MEIKKADNMTVRMMASFDEFSYVRLLLNLVGKYCKMYSAKLEFSTLLKHA
jgi:hypothetical protein